MKGDEECVRFLQWCLPQLGMQWKGFRKVRRQVCRRISERMLALSISSLTDYRNYLGQHPAEWRHLRECCRVTISRFYRDRAVFDALSRQILPRLVKKLGPGRSFRVWSCGSASGEEAYTLRMIWEQSVPTECRLEIVATDTDQELLRRASAGVYGSSSLRELPSDWKQRYFDERGGQYTIEKSLRESISWIKQDVLDDMPKGPFDLVLCRYLIFTYFDHDLQAQVLSRIARVTHPGGALVLGKREELPHSQWFLPWIESLRIYRRLGNTDF